MATAEERLQILSMIRDGKVTADEGTRLLQALQTGGSRDMGSAGREARWLRLKITELRTGAVKFNISLPVSIVRVGMRLGAQFGTGDIGFDNEQVIQAIRAGRMGRIAEIENQTENEHIEIWLE